MSKRKVISFILFVLFVVLLILPVIPVYAQISEPTGTFAVNQVEVYRNCLEELDQLYLITGTIEYTTTPTEYTVDQSYIVRLMNGAINLGNTTFYPYFDSGYDYGMCSIYFTAATAPAWMGAYTVQIQGNPTLHWLDSTATTAMGAAIADDGGVYTDETAAANNPAANDMTLLPVAPAVNDAYYFGSAGMFNILTVNIGQQGNWTGTYAWEYWNGSEWVAVSGLTDNTVGFTAGTGPYDVTYDCPTDWQMTSVNGVSMYYLRFRVVTFAAIVQQPLGTQSWTNTLTNPPTTETSTFSLWYDDGTISGTRDRLTTRLRALALLIENDWGVTVDLISEIAGENKLTAEGEEYFTNSIDNLRDICPDLFADVMTTPDFDEHAFVRDLYMSGDDGDQDVHGVNWYAQTFTTTSNYAMTGVWIKAMRVGNPGNVTASVRATAGGLPTGADLAAGTTNGNVFTTNVNGEWYEVSFTSDANLTINTMYAVVIRATAGNVNNYVGWRDDSTGNYAGGNGCVSVNSGVAWAAIGAGGTDFLFSVIARDAYSASYRDRLAARLIGTPLDMTDLATGMNMSRMWMSTMVWLVLACGIPSYWFCRQANSLKPATMIVAFIMPIGALAGFVYLEIAVLVGFFCGAAAVYAYFYKGSP